MKKSLVRLLVTLLGLALLVYSAYRSVDFVLMTLPPDQQFLALFAIAATELGSVFWLGLFLYDQGASMQHVISLVMMIVDLLGSFALFTFDTLLRTGENGMITKLPQEDIFTVVLGLSVLVAANVAATFAYHAFDPAASKRRAAREVFAHVESEALRLTEERTPQLAAELAPQLAADFLEGTRAQYKALLGSGQGVMDVTARDVPPPAEKKPAFFHWPKMTRPRNVQYNATTSTPEAVSDDHREA